MKIARLAVATLAALVIATPASAQFGRLKKKIKATTAQEKTAAPGDQGGTIVLTDDVVKQLLTGLKAGQAERAAAAKADTPYGRYEKAKAAYAVAQPACEAAKETFPQRAAGKPKVLDKLNALNQKSLAAQTKHDYKLMEIYQDSAMALMDPSCIVKKPKQPRELYQWQREVDTLAQGKEAKTSGFTPNELAMVKERAIAILQGTTPAGDASPMEKAALSGKSAELKPLLGFPTEQAVAQAAEPEPAPASTPEAASSPAPDPQMSAAASKMGACMAKNMQTHQTEIQALAKRVKAAQAAHDSEKLMAIAAQMQQIQMAGCR